MSRMFAAVVLLLAVLSPARVVASPPEVASGKLVFSTDKVAEALRRYQTTRNADTRAALLRKLSTYHDRRAINAGGEALDDREQVVRYEAARLIVDLFCDSGGDDEEIEVNDKLVRAAKEMWRWYQREQEFAAEKARRRAKQLPR